MDFNGPRNMPRGSHYGSNYMKYKSAKLNREVACYSSLEYFNLLCHEVNPEVEKYCEQPPLDVVIFDEDSKIKRTNFDVWVKFFNGYEELEEVKHSNELDETNSENYQTIEQIRKQRKWCEEHNINYTIRTEKDIFLGDFYPHNIEIIAARVRRYSNIDKDYYKKLLRGFIKAEGGAVPIKKLIEAEVLPFDDPFGFLALMYCEGFISMDIKDTPINYKTEVKLNEQ